MFCSIVLQQVAATNLCLKFHHLHLVIVPYLTSYVIFISPLVSLMRSHVQNLKSLEIKAAYGRVIHYQALVVVMGGVQVAGIFSFA